MLQVLQHLIALEGAQLPAHRDALAQLAQVPTPEILVELRLTDQDDLDQLPVLGLQVREQPNLLEHRGAEVLRLVDHEQDLTPRGVLLQQEEVELVDQLPRVAPRARSPNSRLIEESSSISVWLGLKM